MKIINGPKACVVLLLLFSTIHFSFAQIRGTGRLKGEVLDEDGKPIENAKIVVTSLKDQNLSFEVLSDAKGKWALIGFQTGLWRVSVTAEGYLPAFQDRDVRQLKKNPEVIMTLKRIEQTGALTTQDKSSLNLLNQGKKLFSEKKYTEAISAFEQFLEKNPGAYQVHLNIGDCYIQKNEPDMAIEEFDKVLKGLIQEKEGEEDSIGSEIEAKAMTGIGEAYLIKEDFEKAQKFIKKVLEISPTDEHVAFNMGEIYFLNNKIDEAIRYYELSKQINPDWGKPYLKLGYAYLNKGDFEKAKENFTLFIKVDPNSPDVPAAQNVLNYLKKILL